MLDTIYYNEAKEHILRIYNILCPTGKEQRSIVQALHKMELNHEEPESVIKMLCNHLADGINFGNW